MHVGGPGISRLGRALGGGRDQRIQIKAQSQTLSPVRGRNSDSSAGSLRGASQRCRGAGCRLGILPGLTGPGRGRGTGRLPACPATAAVPDPARPPACWGPAGRGATWCPSRSPAPAGLCHPLSQRILQCRAALHLSPYVMRCSLPILAPASG